MKIKNSPIKKSAKNKGDMITKLIYVCTYILGCTFILGCILVLIISIMYFK